MLWVAVCQLVSMTSETISKLCFYAFLFVLFCDNFNFAFLMQEGTIPVTPCIVFGGPNEDFADEMSLHVDRVKLFNVEDAQEGLAVVMAAYWAFNIAYEKKCFSTMCLIERLCLKLDSTPLRAVAIKVMNKVASR